MRTLTAEEAKTYYDKFGATQDKQTFYEDRALNALCANAAFQDAQSVFEFGCGTGGFALRLLQHYLPGTSQYFGTDISSTMVALASKRVASFAPRASVTLASELSLPLESATVDRFVSTYVLDLLPTSGQQQILAEARRVLRPNGLLCLAGITFGISPPSRFVMAVWQSLFARNPNWVGGCRPCRITDYLATEAWSIRFRTVVVAWGVASEVVVASPLPDATHA